MSFVLMFTVGAMGAHAAGQERQLVVVGGYQFEPFIDETGGLAQDFLKLLNEKQDRFEFQFLEMPARRRYALMRSGKIDMILFEMLSWGWEGQRNMVAVTAPVLSGAELFVTRVEAYEADPQVFEHFQEKKLALTLGYHYGFAGFNAEPEYLKKNFNVVLSDFQRHTLRHVVAGSADLAVVNDAFLERAYLADETLRAALKISPKPDQEYRLPVMVRKDGPISAAEMTALLRALKGSGELQAFFEVEGLSKFLIFEK